MRLFSRTTLAAAAALLFVGILFAGGPVKASKPAYYNGKLLSIGGIPGCDCTEKLTECYCYL